jgi:hypothetical protein
MLHHPRVTDMGVEQPGSDQTAYWDGFFKRGGEHGVDLD